MRFSAGMQVLVSDTCRFPGNAALVCTLLLRALPRFLMRAHAEMKACSELDLTGWTPTYDVIIKISNVGNVCVCVTDTVS